MSDLAKVFNSANGGNEDTWKPNPAAVEAWRTFPSDYEWALLDRWLRSFLGSSWDYEARLALNVVAQRKHLSTYPTTEEER